MHTILYLVTIFDQQEQLVLHFFHSLNNLLQKLSVSVWACLHYFLGLRYLSSITSGGTIGLFLPMRKLLQVIGSGSWGSTLTGASGRLMTKLSVSAINVSRVSSFASWPFSLIFREFLCWFDTSFPGFAEMRSWRRVKKPLNSFLWQCLRSWPGQWILWRYSL